MNELTEITRLEWKWKEGQVLAWVGEQVLLSQSIKGSGYARKLRDRLARLGYRSKDIRHFVNGEEVDEATAEAIVNDYRVDQPEPTTRQKCLQCALANTPANVRVIQIRKDLSGRAYTNAKYSNFGKIEVPRPITRKSLYIFLHECAHMHLHADGKRRKVYVIELEAEQWAHARMREAGIPVPRSMTLRAKSYVRQKMRRAFKRGTKRFDAAALKYTGSKQIGGV